MPNRSEVAVDVPALLRDRRDALQVMGLQGANLLSPYDSWVEKLGGGAGGQTPTY